jgi:iron(III) transport system permease protein
MDEAGQVSAAAAMACVILAISLTAKLSEIVASRVLIRFTSAWRR